MLESIKNVHLDLDVKAMAIALKLLTITQSLLTIPAQAGIQ